MQNCPCEVTACPISAVHFVKSEYALKIDQFRPHGRIIGLFGGIKFDL